MSLLNCFCSTIPCRWNFLLQFYRDLWNVFDPGTENGAINARNINSAHGQIKAGATISFHYMLLLSQHNAIAFASLDSRVEPTNKAPQCILRFQNFVLPRFDTQKVELFIAILISLCQFMNVCVFLYFTAMPPTLSAYHPSTS